MHNRHIIRLWPLAALAALAGLAGPQQQSAQAATVVSRIAYASAFSEEVSTVNLDGGAPVALAPGSDPLIAPDGTLVAVVPKESRDYPDSGPSLIVYSTLGAAPIQVTQGATVGMRPEAFSPDSRYLAVAVTSSNSEGFPVEATSGIGVLDTESGAFTMIAHGIVSGASFNPTGAGELVYGNSSSEGLHARSNLYIWAPGFAAPRQITTDGRSLKPVWGPHDIAYAHAHPRHGDAPEPRYGYALLVVPPGRSPTCGLAFSR
jgi:hypothetical protein